MIRRGGAVHVATTTRRYKDKVYQTHLLRRTYREGGKVRHQTLGNLSHLPPETIEVVRASLAGEKLLPLSSFRIARSTPHGHVAAVWAMATKLGLAEVLGPPGPSRDLVLALVVARVCRPGSKLATTRWWARSTLGADLGVSDASTDDVYAAMDWLHARQADIEAALAGRHLAEGGMVLYDVSSSYVEGTHCPLAARGHSRDNKPGTAQIVYGLTTDPEGRPVAIEVFEGNTADPTTFPAAVEKVRNRFGLSQVVMVGDRGMITKARIEALAEIGGVGWITSLRAPAIKALAEAGSIQVSLFDEANLAEITHPDYPAERLVACRNPALGAERGRKREELLQATEHELDKVVVATSRKRAPLRGKDKIGVRVGRVAGRFKMAKHFVIEIGEDTLTYARDQARIEAEAALDGIYVIRTSVAASELSAADVVSAYKRLAEVEADFRSLKTVDLELRPIHHWRPERVRAHALICMLARYLAWHLRRAWAELTFADEEPACRSDPVAPAKRSATAWAKASTRRTSQGRPTESFATLLEELATLTRNQIEIPGDSEPFEMLSTPSELQRRAFELLGVKVPIHLV
ncbi:MAG TPA: IS1634 family transposase [Acidimicrobiia bacterium]|jgi:hypothetical protein|nr:IS1634 family transposase [Acidimicrobiia bacterium]